VESLVQREAVLGHPEEWNLEWRPGTKCHCQGPYKKGVKASTFSSPEAKRIL